MERINNRSSSCENKYQLGLERDRFHRAIKSHRTRGKISRRIHNAALKILF